MKLNQKGAALMQVLLITVILAGMATMLLRASLSRTTSARRTRRAATSQVLIEACMAQINSLWAGKTATAYQRDLLGAPSGDQAGRPFMYCKTVDSTSGRCTAGEYTYTCSIRNPARPSSPYKIEASFVQDSTDSSRWNLVYEMTSGSDNI